ncbi:MAG: hypothetical protein NXI15_07295 [Gammaproteobacteria bacterium]|jgi:uncharacterized protein YqgV (UPF0045/DUF77 family)|nr:hypothetical protein [Gammaproteobacteria bacterium]
MRITAELSLYPFNEHYITQIKAFIEFLNDVPELHVETHATCTIIHGEDQRVMDTIRDGLRWCHRQEQRVVLVTKFIPGHRIAAPDEDTAKH